jgi:hypothetical protein
MEGRRNVRRGSPRIVFLLLGMALLAIGDWERKRVSRLVEAGTTAQGTVWTVTKGTLFVQIEGERGRTRYIPTHRPWWALFRYRPGDAVTILHDPRELYDQFLFRRDARLHSWAALWLAAIVYFAVGLLLIALCVLSWLFPRNVHLDARAVGARRR